MVLCKSTSNDGSPFVAGWVVRPAVCRDSSVKLN